MHIVHALFTPVNGGLEQSFVNTTEALVSRGHKVTAIIRSNAPYRDAVARHASTMMYANPLGMYDICTAWKIRRILKSMRPDLLLAHNGRAISQMAFTARRLGIPLVGVSHSYKTLRAMQADALVLLSKHMRDAFLVAGCMKPTEIIPNLIHLAPKPVFKKRGDIAVIGAIGRFTPEKGIQDFIEALTLLKQSGTAFKVRLAGDGPDAAELKALAEERGVSASIEWLGWVADKAAFYNGIDILCLPSREDSFPMVILETLAAGVAIVATDAPGPADMLRDGVSGLIVPRRNPQAMADALKRLIVDSQLAENLAEAGWKRVQDFGFDAVADKWNQFISAATPVLKQH